MNDDDDKLYLERRVSEELHRAQTAHNPDAIKAHYMMLGHYLDQLYGSSDLLRRAH